MEKKILKNKNKMYKLTLVLILILFHIGLIFVGLVYKKTLDSNKEEEKYMSEIRKKQSKEELLSKIKGRYSKYIVVVNDSKLFSKKEDKFIEIGKVYKDSIFTLEDKNDLTVNDVYFKLENLDYYLSYDAIKKTEKQDVDTSFKKYLPYDIDVVTKEETTFYLNDKKSISINKSFTLPIIINDNNYYHVEFDGKLYSVKKEDILKTVINPKGKKETKSIGVLNYHSFYDPDKNDYCRLILCISKKYFESHLKYLKDNNFVTLSMKDLDLWMKKKIRLPKSVVITVDDGAKGTGITNGNVLIPSLEKYKLHATLFLITSYWPKENYQSPYLTLQSHGHDIHNHLLPYKPALRMTKEQLLEDFDKSIKILNGDKTSFAYPFYAYNDTVLKAVIETGFHLAFIGGNKKIKQTDNPILLSRYIIYNNTTLDKFIKMVN